MSKELLFLRKLRTKDDCWRFYQHTPKVMRRGDKIIKTMEGTRVELLRCYSVMRLVIGVTGDDVFHKRNLTE